MSSATHRATGPLPDPLRDKIIAVASGKGGVGKTWLSISLAHGLALAGQRILLFDGDIGLANIDIQLGLEPTQDLGAVVEGRSSLKEVVLRYQRGGFDVIAGRSGSGSLSSLPLTRLRDLVGDLKRLAGGYDRVILDLGAGIEQTVRFLAAQAGTCLVITNDEPTALTDAYAFIKLTSKMGAACDLRILVNMAQSQREGERTYMTLRKACESFLGLTPSLAGVLLRDPKVREAIRHQVPILTRHPTSNIAKEIESLAKTLR